LIQSITLKLVNALFTFGKWGALHQIGLFTRYLFALSLLLFPTWSFSSPTANHCITGYKPAPNYLDTPDEYQSAQGESAQPALVPKTVNAWFIQHNWIRAYQYWEADFFEGNPPPLNTANSTAPACNNKAFATRYLSMNKFMLQTARTLWPNLHNTFSAWPKFPVNAEAYPQMEQAFFSAWPNEIIAQGKLVDQIPKMRHSELLGRWPTEGDFAHWLLCGSNSLGLNKDSLIGALSTNTSSLQPLNNATFSNLGHYSFWKTTAWLDRAWNTYRKRMGKTPFEPKLQAQLIQQCHVFNTYLDKPHSANYRSRALGSKEMAPVSSTLFVNGALNPQYLNRKIRLMGRVGKMQTVGGRVYIQLQPYLQATRAVWVTSGLGLSEVLFSEGEPLVVIGMVRLIPKQDQTTLHDALMISAMSVQSAK